LVSELTSKRFVSSRATRCCTGGTGREWRVERRSTLIARGRDQQRTFVPVADLART
jgi:hypothetical protein